MAQLLNQTQNKVLSQHLTVAESFYARAKGLLGKPALDNDEMLWIKKCNSIHTFFMRFPIDCVFLDKQNKVCGLRANVSQWRIVLPILRARSVVEMKADSIRELNIQRGDQFHVGY